MASTSSRRFLLAAIGVLALAVGMRVGAAWWWESRLPEGERFGWGDSASYWELGEDLYRGRAYEYGGASVFRTPGYPALIAGAFALWGGEPPVWFVRAIGVAVGALTVAATMALAARFFNGVVTIGAGLVSALLPDAAGMSVFVLSEGLFCLLMTMQLWAFVVAGEVACRKRKAFYAILAGGFAAAAILTRPSWLLFPPLAALTAVILSARKKEATLVHAAALIATALALAPWWLRNYQVADRFVPTTLQTGASLYDGLRPGADGASDMRFVGPMRESFRRDQPAAAGTPAEEALFDRYLRDAAVDWAVDHPGEALRLAGVKFLRMWSPLPNADEMRSPIVQAAMFCTYVPLMIGAIGGLWRFLPRRRDLLWLAAPAVYFTLLHLVFVSSIRYRQPALPLLGILAVAWYVSLRFPKDSVLRAPTSRGETEAP